jgi:hypothetical protein
VSTTRDPASAGSLRVRALALVVVVVVAALVGGGCSVGGGSEDDGAGAGLPRELGEKPSPLRDPAPAAPTTTTGRAATTTAVRARGGTRATSPTATPTTLGSRSPSSTTGAAAARTPFRSLVKVDDGSGDAGLQAQPYGDLRSLAVEDDGEHARFTVDLGGDVPDPLPAGETMGVGVDLFHGGGRESEYQLFADGDEDGWLAYLQAPSGFVAYPGTFELGGHQLVFVVPWSAIGGHRSGTVSAFADWTRKGLAVVAAASEDHVPDGNGSTPYAR